jgi:ligand-binding sensor domain-containing protein
LPTNTVFGIQEDDKGLLWMSTENGLSRFDPARLLNGEAGRSVNIDLSFLGEGDYKATMVQDKRPNLALVSLVRSRKTFGAQQGVNIIKATATNRESLLVELIPGGGFVAVFEK